MVQLAYYTGPAGLTNRSSHGGGTLLHDKLAVYNTAVRPELAFHAFGRPDIVQELSFGEAV